MGASLAGPLLALAAFLLCSVSAQGDFGGSQQGSTLTTGPTSSSPPTPAPPTTTPGTTTPAPGPGSDCPPTSTTVNLRFADLYHEVVDPGCSNCGPMDGSAPSLQLAKPPPSNLSPPRFSKVLPK